ncbi:MAG: hypothetical protein MZW92_75845 [Comamonadaceae bacterium]|nr:hypothetical protein [Comamonadaceae bacterium]
MTSVVERIRRAPESSSSRTRSSRSSCARPAKFGEIVTFTCAYSGREPGRGCKFVDETARQSRGSSGRIPGPTTSTTGSPASTTRTTRPPARSWPRSRRASRSRPTAGSSASPRTRPPGRSTYHWSQDLPHSTYLIFLAAAPYVVVRDSYGTCR